LVLLPVLFNLICLYPELSISRRSLNDNVFHFVASQRMSQALTSGENPVDAWLGEFSAGYPLWRSYQPVPHLATGIAFKVTAPFMQPWTVFLLINYLLLSFLPVCFYALARSLGMGRLASGAAAALSIAASEADQFARFGIGYGAFVWRGTGLYTQLWGLVLTLLALSCLLGAVRRGRGLVMAGVFLALAALSHIVAGYIAVATALLLVVTGFRDGTPAFPQRAFRTAVAMAVALVLIAFFVVPMVLDSSYINHSRWEPAWKWDSFGAEAIGRALANGTLLDDGRLPILTLLAAAGLVIAALRSRRCRTARALVVLTGFWLLMFFGRTTWGHLLELAGVPADMHLHRFQVAFEIFAVLVAALAVELLLRPLASHKGWLPWAAAGLVLIALLAPMYAERAKYLATNARWGTENLAAYRAESKDIEAMLDRVERLKRTVPGRVHAGRAGDWGGRFKVGSMPVYSLLAERGIPSSSFLYHSLSSASDTMVLIQEWRPGDLELFGVRYVIAPDGVPLEPSLLLRGVFGRFRLYEVPGAGFFQIISVPYAFEGTPETVFETSRDWLANPLRQFRQYIALYPGKAPLGIYKQVLHRWEPLPLPAADSPPPGEILSESKAGEVYRAQVHAGGDCFVLFRSSFHPGLKAEVDGVRVQPVMVTPGLTAIPINGGTHQMTVFYEAGMLKPVLAVLGLLVVCLAAFASRRGLLAKAETVVVGRAAQLGHALDASRRPWIRTSLAWGRRHWVYLLLVLAIALVSLRPCYRGLLMDGHDSTCYPPRIVEFHENVRHGIVAPVWAPDLANGFGQPLFEFIPPFLHGVAEVFYAAGAKLADSLQFAVLALGLLAAFSMYAIGVRLGSRRAGLVMAAAYLFCCYVQLDLYVRGAFQEFSGLAVLPFAVWTLWLAMDTQRFAKTALASLGIALLALSHSVVALIGVPTLALFAAALAGRDWRRLLRAGTALAGGLGLAAFYWAPALWEKQLVHIERFPLGFYAIHFVFPIQLLYSAWGYGYSVAGPGDGMSFMLGPVHLVLAALGFALVLWRVGVRTIVGRFAVAAALTSATGALMSMQLSEPLWKALPVIQYLQFPWRFLALPGLGLSLLAGLGIVALGSGGRARWAYPVAAVVAMALFGLLHAKPSRFLPFDDEFYEPTSIARRGINTLTREEYEPVWVKMRPPYTAVELEPLTGLPGFRARPLPGRTPEFHGYQVDATQPCRVRVNTFFYPGWEIAVNGVPIKISIEDVWGRMLVDLPSGSYVLTVQLRDTSLRAASRWISFLTAVLLLAAVIRSRRRNPPEGGLP
jgi:hypothetical protein